MRSRLVDALVAVSLASALLAAFGRPGAGEPTHRVDVSSMALKGFREQIVLTGLDQPVNVEFSPDGRLFVAEKAGLVKVFDGLADPTPTIFADLRQNVHNQGDRGLLGLALHPGFPVTPYVYVLYTYDAPPGRQAPVWRDDCGAVGGVNGGRCVVTGRLSRLTAGGVGTADGVGAADGDRTADGVGTAGGVGTAYGVGAAYGVGTAGGHAIRVNEEVLLHGWCQQYGSHSVGDVRFGPDGALYVTAGEGASWATVDYGQLGPPAQRNPCRDPAQEGGALRAQDVRTPADPTGVSGAVLRLDPETGEAAGGNPLGASDDPGARRIVAYGLRNPYRFTFRPGTSELWLGDVGWGTWDEIDRLADPVAGPANFGWPCYEGVPRQGGYDGANLALCEELYPGGEHRVPHHAYRRGRPVVPGEACPANTGQSISGLAFYREGNYPAEYRGALLFADYARDCVWALLPDAAGVPAPGSGRVLVAGAANPVDLAIGPGGDLYYVDVGGTVRRLRYFAGNQPPTAVLLANTESGSAPLVVEFDARDSSDPDPGDAGMLRYEWDFTDDGTVDATTPTATHTYATGGRYTARLRVTDTLGATDTATVAIQSGNTPPVGVIEIPAPATTYTVGDRIHFVGRATDAEQGALPVSGLRWRLLQHHCYTGDNCHVHTEQEWTGVAGGYFDAPDHEYPSYLELKLTATDAQGLTHTSGVRLDPRTVDLTFATSPPKLRVAVGGTAESTPFTRTVIQGSSNSVSAVTPQIVGDVTYTFSSWSDGGAQTHVITAPATPTTYTATYRTTGPSGGATRGGGGRATR